MRRPARARIPRPTRKPTRAPARARVPTSRPTRRPPRSRASRPSRSPTKEQFCEQGVGTAHPFSRACGTALAAWCCIPRVTGDPQGGITMKKLLPLVVAGFTAATLSLPGFAGGDSKNKQSGADAKTGTSADVQTGASVGSTGVNAGAGATTDTEVDAKKNRAKERKSRDESNVRESERGSGAASGSTSSTPSAPSGNKY